MSQAPDPLEIEPLSARGREGGFGYQLVRYVFDEKRRLLGYLVIDSLVKGRSCGGIRMRKDVSASEISGLARTMTLKYGFAGVPNGGAKAGMIGDPDVPNGEKERLLLAFGRYLKPLIESGMYIPAADMGTSSEEIRFMLQSMGMKVPERRPRRHGGFYTSMSVVTAAEQAARHLGLDLSRARLAVEGFGEVGSSVAEVFAARGARVVAVSTERGAIYNEKGLQVERLLRLYREAGSGLVEAYGEAERIDKHLLPELEVDVFSPCAGPHSIHVGNAGRVAARIICPGANTPETPEAKELLFQRGILSVPDFAANCGGILAFLVDGKSDEDVLSFFQQRVGQSMAVILEEAEKRDLPVGTVAEERAEQRFLCLKRKLEEERASLLRRTARFLLRHYEKAGLPDVPVRLIHAWNAKKKYE